MMVVNKTKAIFLAAVLILISPLLKSQENQAVIDYNSPYDYIIGGVSVSGVRFLDPNALIGI